MQAGAGVRDSPARAGARVYPYEPERSTDSIPLHLQDNVGNIAINDSFMLEAAIYYLLKKHFRQEKHYVDLLEIFHEASAKKSEFVSLGH